jgi:leucyl aminopeptidase
MTTLTRPAAFDPIPSVAQAEAVTVTVAAAVPPTAGAVGVPVTSDGEVPEALGLSRAALAGAGFGGEVGETLVLPRSDGPFLVAVGIGDRAALDTARLRDAAAAFARAAGRQARLAGPLADVPAVPPELAAQVVVEGVLLARYRFNVFKNKAEGTPLTELTIVAPPERHAALQRGAARGRVTATAANLARDLSNTPPAYLTATRLGELAQAIGPGHGLEVEVFDKDAVVAMGLGGLLGVNAGSVEPPRLIKLTYRPKSASGEARTPTGHLALVGKGVMYDSGGISLKPTDAVHATMKVDMAGAGNVLGAMTALAALDCTAAVTGYLMCTDNMPSGSATKLGDVLTIRGGKTVEVMNIDAEGRLVMADGMVLATEERPRPDAIVDIGTLTGAAMRALGEQMAAVLGDNQHLVDQVIEASRTSDEPVWQLPLNTRYRKYLSSEIADLRNIGGENAGAITAALFLAEFTGGIPWAHLDIAGTAMVNADESWRPRGATAYATRLLIDLALRFAPPAGAGS